MKRHTVLRGVLILLVVQLLVGSVVWGATGYAQTDDLTAAVEQAVVVYLGNQLSTEVIVSNVKQDTNWAFGSVYIPASENSPSPRTFLFLARFHNDNWEAVLDTELLFQEWLAQLPDTLVSKNEKAILSIGPTLAGDGSGQLSLPWPTGETWTLTGGPHIAVDGNVRNALDFAGGSGEIRASRDGIAYYSASCPNFISIVHGGGWKTTYYHAINISVGYGQSVSRGQFLGHISSQAGCGGSASGDHVHFATYLNNVDKAMHGLDIGGWTVENGSTAYEGCMVRIKDGLRQCAGQGQIYNDGSIGSGAPPNQPPHKPTLLSPSNGSVTSNTSVTLQWKDNGDPDDGPRGYNDFAAELSSDGTKVAESGWIDETSWSVSDLDPGTYSWKVKAGDGDTNSGFGASWTFTVDTAAPTGDLTLNYGWQQASGVNVPLELSASDEHSRVSEMRLGQDCSSLGDWQPYQTARWWQLDGQHGDTAGVCVQYRDRAGNESATVEKSLTLDFYPTQPASSRYRLAADVVALGGSQASSQNYSLHATSGQVLASGDYASSTNYRAALGYWAAVQRDTTPPVVTVESLLTKDATPALHGTVDDAQATVELLLDSNTYNATNNGDGTWRLADNTISPALRDGTYDVVATATDQAGNVGTDSTTDELIVDTTPPSTTIESLLTKDATPALHGTVDDVQATIELLLDSQTYNATNHRDGTWTLPDNTISPALHDGTYDVVITATDTIGHVGTDNTSDELIIDTKAPSVTVDVLITSVTTPALRGTVDDASATVALLVDSQSYTTTNKGDGTWMLAEGVITPTLQDGTYDVAVTATDRAGNVGSDSTTDELTIDVTPPEEPTISGVVSDTLRSEDGRLTITGTAEASSTVTIMLNGEVISTTTTDEQGNWHVDYGDETLPDGEHTLVIQTTDAAGNTSTREVTLVVDTASSYDLQLSISDGKRTVTTGEVLTYTLRYTNTGAITASGVLLTAQVPTNTTVVAAGTADWQCSGTSCSLAVGDVAVGAHGEHPFAVKIAEAMPANVDHVVLHASCQGNESSKRTERQPANNDASITTQVDAQPDLRIALQSQDYNQQTGLLTVTLGYGNQGNQDAVQVWLQVSFPSPVTGTVTNAAAALNDTWDCTGASTSGGRCVYEIGELAAGAQGSQQVGLDTQGYTGNLKDLMFEATITDGSERERNPADNTIQFTPEDTPEPVSPGAKQSLHLPLVLR
jgi:uncharacterized repeat protein (TIGR01451 family)